MLTRGKPLLMAPGNISDATLVGVLPGGWSAAVQMRATEQQQLAHALHQAAVALQVEIEGLQYPAVCDRLLLYDFSQAFGFGAHAHMLSLALNIAHYTRRTLVTMPSSSWCDQTLLLSCAILQSSTFALFTCCFATVGQHCFSIVLRVGRWFARGERRHAHTCTYPRY